MTDDRERWALILGGVVRDGRGHRPRSPRRATTSAASISTSAPRSPTSRRSRPRSRPPGREALYINMNAADDEKRARGARDAARAVRRVRARRAASRTSAS